MSRPTEVRPEEQIILAAINGNFDLLQKNIGIFLQNGGDINANIFEIAGTKYNLLAYLCEIAVRGKKLFEEKGSIIDVISYAMRTNHQLDKKIDFGVKTTGRDGGKNAFEILSQYSELEPTLLADLEINADVGTKFKMLFLSLKNKELAKSLKEIAALLPRLSAEEINKRLQYGDDKITPLQAAILLKRPDLIDDLLKKGASPAVASMSGKTALHFAAKIRDSDKAAALLTKLIAANPDKNFVHQKDFSGITALEYALAAENYGGCFILMKEGAKPRDIMTATRAYLGAKKIYPKLVTEFEEQATNAILNLPVTAPLNENAKDLRELIQSRKASLAMIEGNKSQEKARDIINETFLTQFYKMAKRGARIDFDDLSDKDTLATYLGIMQQIDDAAIKSRHQPKELEELNELRGKIGKTLLFSLTHKWVDSSYHEILGIKEHDESAENEKQKIKNRAIILKILSEAGEFSGLQKEASLMSKTINLLEKTDEKFGAKKLEIASQDSTTGRTAIIRGAKPASSSPIIFTLSETLFTKYLQGQADHKALLGSAVERSPASMRRIILQMTERPAEKALEAEKNAAAIFIKTILNRESSEAELRKSIEALTDVNARFECTNFDAKNNVELTPLQIAIMLGRADAAQILLQQPKIDVRKTSSDGKTALHFITELSDRKGEEAAKIIGAICNHIGKNLDKEQMVNFALGKDAKGQDFLDKLKKNHPQLDVKEFLKPESLGCEKENPFLQILKKLAQRKPEPTIGKPKSQRTAATTANAIAVK